MAPRGQPAEAEYACKSGNSRYRVQVSSGGWSADYPAPGTFIELKLSCRAFRPRSDYVHNAGRFCDPALDRQVDRAQGLQAGRPHAANALLVITPRTPISQPSR